MKFLNFHDILIIGAIVVLTHIIVHPLYERLDGSK